VGLGFPSVNRVRSNLVYLLSIFFYFASKYKKYDGEQFFKLVQEGTFCQLNIGWS